MSELYFEAFFVIHAIVVYFFDVIQVLDNNLFGLYSLSLARLDTSWTVNYRFDSSSFVEILQTDVHFIQFNKLKLKI